MTKECQVNFVRYADDFVITGSSKELLESEVRPLVHAFLAERGLRLSEEKTHVTHISDGFDFLGQNVRKYHLGTSNERLLIKPSSMNIKRLWIIYGRLSVLWLPRSRNRLLEYSTRRFMAGLTIIATWYPKLSTQRLTTLSGVVYGHGHAVGTQTNRSAGSIGDTSGIWGIAGMFSIVEFSGKMERRECWYCETQRM